MSIPECPEFRMWYWAIHGREPFPWQDRLAKQIAETGQWPDLVGIPTGLGKTVCIDIAVWALAHQADRDPRDRTASTRIWWVVNRRILVDSTYNHALKLEALLANPKNPSPYVIDDKSHSTEKLKGVEAEAVEAVAERLRGISGFCRPLQALRVRGGDSHNRPRHPAQPAIICSTIPMYGSRLLFRGYGSSKSMRPIDAALAGTDSLVLLDEAHLAQPLRVLLNAVSDSGKLGADPESVLPARRMSPTVTALTATGDKAGNRFDLDQADHDCLEIQKRLEASKPLSIQIAEGDPAIAITETAKRLLDTLSGGETFGILAFVNTPKTALLVAKKLKLRRDCEVVVATGRTRGVEARKAIDVITDRMLVEQSSNKSDGQHDKHLVVIATQTLEVGADLDADYLITEACGTRALIQRLGRLNRLGQRSHARGVYVHVEPRDNRWPVYGEEPSKVLGQLERAVGFDKEVQMSPGNIGEVLGDPPAEPADVPVFAEALLWEWVKTSSPPPGEAPVEPYFSGWLEQERDVNVVWRAYVPKPGKKIWPRISPEEIVSVPIIEIGKALEELGTDDLIKVGSDQATAEQIEKNDDDGLKLRTGDTIVVTCNFGNLNDDGHWDLTSKELVVDASIISNGLAIDNKILKGLYKTEPTGPKAAMNQLYSLLNNTSGEEPEPEDIQSAVIEFSEELEKFDVPPSFDNDQWREEWKEFTQKLKSATCITPSGEVPRLPINTNDEHASNGLQISFDEYDELSIAESVSLEKHGNDTAGIAQRIAAAIGIEGRANTVVEKSSQFHDIGKADTRFQNWLDPQQNDSNLVAKSDTPRSQWERHRKASGWPRGGRHEELSRRLTQAWLSEVNSGFREDEQKLLLHLVVAHHGRGRPLVDPVKDLTGTKVAYQVNGRKVEVDADLSEVDWDQPARFNMLNRKYGCWGLALLETIVRQADHIASRAVDDTTLEIR